MADQKVTELSEGTPAPGSILYGVTDPTGTPSSVYFDVGRITGPMVINQYSTDQTIDVQRQNAYMMTGNTERTFTFSAFEEADDMAVFYVGNNSASANLTVVLPGTTTFQWSTISPDKIHIPPGTSCIFLYNHTANKIGIISKQGKIQPKETLLYAKGRDFVRKSGNIFVDRTGNAVATTSGGAIGGFLVGSRNPPFAVFTMSGTDGYTMINDFAGDLFDDQTDSVCLGAWNYHISDGNILTYYEDQNNYWTLQADGGSYLFTLADGGSKTMELTSSTAPSSAWVHLAVVKVGSDVGLYVDGTQESHDTLSTTKSMSGGEVRIGSSVSMIGGVTASFAGAIDDVFIVEGSNIFAAAPNSTPDDSFTIVAGSFLDLVR